MLPDDYENLSESIIASSAFMNNILQAITTKNYWNAANIYKPLMHTWYIGVLVQIYFFISIILWLINKTNEKEKNIKITLITIYLFSIALYLLPYFSSSDKFYYFPFRLYEFVLGCLIFYFPARENQNINLAKTIGNVCFFIICFLLLSNININNSFCVLLVSILTAICIYCNVITNDDFGIRNQIELVITYIGRYSFFFYIWHQVIISILRYSFFQNVTIVYVFLVLVLTFVISIPSIYIHKRFVALSLSKKIVITVVATVLVCFCSFYIYLRAGVVKDIYELGVEKNKVHRHMWAEYVDIPYSWNVDFKDKDKIHIVVMGDSFGRDFANILNESHLRNRIEISYIYGENASNYLDRINIADYVFYGSAGWGVPKWIIENVSSDKFYYIGNKSFGESNGIIYHKRYNSDYYQSRCILDNDFIFTNYSYKGIYGDHYIDMIGPLCDGNNIRVFTDDGHYISQDCKHLTKYGALYYSQILDLEFIK